MDAILQGLMALGGARAAMVLDPAGRVVAHLGHAVYDRALCEQVGGDVVKAIESIQLQQEQWETITAQYADGRILVRRVGVRAPGARHVLALVADQTLNAPFATVALRVAANKVRDAIDGGGSQSAASSQALAGSHAASAPPPAASSSAASAADSRPVLANTGLSWTKGSAAGSSVSASGFGAADPASAAFLARCAKTLARHVGPMAKVYVQEAVRRVCPDAAFTLAHARQVVDDVATQIEDPKDRAQFRSAALEKS
jgi:predicted regulator of Ras-like GTPase activity (Roadblock/LC7/MglB family)